MLNINLEEFNKNLLLTQQYCQSKRRSENVASDLRSFNPEIDGQPMFSYRFEDRIYSKCWITVWNVDPIMGNDKYLYDELYEKQLIYKKECIKTPGNVADYKGKILIAEIDMTVVDGASEAESEGLIDNNDCPPIDNLVYIISQRSSHIWFFK